MTAGSIISTALRKLKLLTDEIKLIIVRLAEPLMVLSSFHDSTPVTISCFFPWSPAVEIQAIISHPEPNVQDAGVVEAQPQEESVGSPGLQLSQGLVVFIEDGSQVHLSLPAVLQGMFPRLILLDQLKG